ncbi:DUF1176 domain-containing protein [Sphingomonas endolithica]|uniref:DUF1176 domain-containing protein n=1 Tax=Sphingomonas endolithica TaxID=2972485 RepID=UPI0021AF1B68|nr:DUF1176 domain-containing protein [Sphingomonas sp. ZFBP2030]
MTTVRPIRQTLLSIAAFMSLSAASPSPIIQSYDDYQSWLVACDNTLTCVARGFDDSNPGAEIEIGRAAGPSGAITASISALQRFTLADIRVDGTPANLRGPKWQVIATDDQTSATTNDLATVRALVQQLRNASAVTLGGGDAQVPLAGFAAAMLRLDDRQGRSGGVTAVLKPGTLPASRVPAPPPLPKIPHHPISARLAPGEEGRLIAAVRASQKALLAKEECGETPEQPEAHALDGRQALVLLPCVMGAYQGSSLAFIASRTNNRAQRLVAPTPYLGQDPDRSRADFFTNAGFDADTGTLSMGAKGRGLADCGFSADWIWDGTSFRLSEMTLQRSCGGLEPGDWPVLYRSMRQ